MRFIRTSSFLAAVLAVALLAGCSTPAPVPPAVTAPPPQPAPPLAAPVQSQSQNQDQDQDQDRQIVKGQFQQAIAFMRAGKDREATALFANIAKLDPALASPHTNLGILFYREAKLDQAEAAFKDALRLDAKDYVAANYLGMIYRQQGRFSDSEAAYLQALRAKPDYGYAHLNLAILYDIYLDNLPRALDHYQEYQRISGDSDQQLAGWLADLRQRMKTLGEEPKP
ncbi:MAG: tetratricopeptide repeat protein [Gallionellaceae bacterium]